MVCLCLAYSQIDCFTTVDDYTCDGASTMTAASAEECCLGSGFSYIATEGSCQSCIGECKIAIIHACIY